jgi:predicted PolB exonuclease-like 3'-5' exonuclease
VKDRISLDRLCKVLGLPGKDDMTGADVWPYVQAGRLDEVAEYCRQDVRRVREIFQRMNFQRGDVEAVLHGSAVA